LFWLSCIPFSTAWLGENGGEKAPTLQHALGKNIKAKVSNSLMSSKPITIQTSIKRTNPFFFLEKATYL